MKKLPRALSLLCVLLPVSGVFSSLLEGVPAFAKEKDPEFQKKIDQKIAMATQWAKSKEVLEAFGSQDAALAAKYEGMTNEKWKTLTVLDPLVRDLSKSPAALFLKSRKEAEPSLSEAFLSRADGGKVAFIGKPSSWSHKGKAKHDVPMTGKAWQGEIETDASSGSKQIQVAVPVLVGGKPIGSLVIGLKITLL